MFQVMRNLDQSRRFRQAVLAAAALIGLAVLVLTIATAHATRAHAAAADVPLTAGDRADLERVSLYLNGLKDLQGGFLQVGPDGSLAEGRFYLRRPGRLRFEYT